MFKVFENNDNTYRIECLLVVYRAMLGRHPDFLKPEGDAVNGYNTKYYILIEDRIPSEEHANKQADSYNAKYADLINKCEESGDWSDFPFKDCEIVYYK